MASLIRSQTLAGWKALPVESIRRGLLDVVDNQLVASQINSASALRYDRSRRHPPELLSIPVLDQVVLAEQ